jgi:hypothetical protein
MERKGPQVIAIALFTVLALLQGFGLGSQPTRALSCSPGTSAWDFDANGCSDIAIGAHGEDIGTGSDAGSLNVLFGQPTIGIDSEGNQFWNQDTPGVPDVAESRDWFGRSRESGDYNGDGVADLAVGAYGETSQNLTHEHAGAVHVFYGVSGTGLTLAGQQYVTQANSGTAERPETNDYFGRALASGYFNGDVYEDLAIGADGDTRSGHPGAGCVIVLYGSAGGLNLGSGQLWTQGRSFGLKDGAEEGDGFGIALDAGDFDGDGFDDLVVGAVSEDRSMTVFGSGAVSVIFGSGSGLQDGSLGLDDQFITQDNDGADEDPAESDDQFGRDLAVGNFNGDISSSGHPIDDLAIGARQEDVVVPNDNAGSVTVMLGVEGRGLNQSADGLFVTEEVLAGGDGAEATDDFGRGLEAGNFNGDAYDDLAIGADFEHAVGNCPPENGSCLTGGVHVLSG